MSGKPTKEQLAEALRQYPSWGHTYIAEKERADSASHLLLRIEGALLGYWTDIPQEWLQEVLPQIRETLGDWEPVAASAPSEEAR